MARGGPVAQRLGLVPGFCHHTAGPGRARAGFEAGRLFHPPVPFPYLGRTDLGGAYRRSGRPVVVGTAPGRHALHYFVDLPPL